MSDQSDAMTPAQRKAICDAWNLLTEHFERVLLVVDFEIEDEHGRGDAHQGYWHGGSMAAIGMALWARDRAIESGRLPNCEP